MKDLGPVPQHEFDKLIGLADPLEFFTTFMVPKDLALDEDQTNRVLAKVPVSERSCYRWMYLFNRGAVFATRSLARSIFQHVTANFLYEFYLPLQQQFCDTCSKFFPDMFAEINKDMAIIHWTREYKRRHPLQGWDHHFTHLGVCLTENHAKFILIGRDEKNSCKIVWGKISSAHGKCQTIEHPIEYEDTFRKDLSSYLARKRINGYVFSPYDLIREDFLPETPIPAESKEDTPVPQDPEDIPEESKRAFPTSWKEADKLLNLQYGSHSNLLAEVRKALLLVENRVFHHFEFLSIYNGQDQWEKSCLPEALGFLHSLSKNHTQAWDKLLTCETHFEFMTLWSETQKKLFPAPKAGWEKMVSDKEFFELESTVSELKEKMVSLAEASKEEVTEE